MPAIRHDTLLLRLLKDLQDVRSALRRVAVNLPLFDIANENTPAQLTADQDNYAIGNYDVIRLSSDAPRVISGFRVGMRGRSIKVLNVGNFSICMSHQNSSSDPENRFNFRDGLPAIIGAGDIAIFYYDQTQSRWVEGTQLFEFNLGEHWTLVYEAPDMVVWSWWDLAWSSSLDLMVAVGNSKLMSSTDGLTWTERVMPANNADLFRVVTWSPDLGLFCAVSEGGNFGSAGEKVITSPDGINWTLRVSVDDNDLDDWFGVAWSPSLTLFAAVGFDFGAGTDNVMTSPDGTNWTIRTGANGAGYSSVVWADDLALFVAVGAGGIMTSPDGTNWTTRSAVSTLLKVIWSDELDLLVATGSEIWTSADGITWTQRAIPIIPSSNLTGASYSPALDMFLVLNNTPEVLQSPDGVTWTETDAPVIVDTDTSYSAQPLAVIWVTELGRFVAIGSSKANDGLAALTPS